MYIKDKNEFYKNLINYVYKCLTFYNLEETYDNIKMVLSFTFVNISKSEMNDLDTYLNKYINFLYDKVLSNKKVEKLKKELIDKKLNDDYNSTIKFNNK